MQVLNFPGCCTAKVIVGFGEEASASYRADENYTDRSMALELNHLIRGPQIGTRMGSVVVQLTSRQQRGIRVLTALGFASTVAQPKDNHSDTSLFTFTINPREYISANRDINALFPAPVAPNLLVKTLEPRALYQYRRLRKFSSGYIPGSYWHNYYLNEAMRIKNNPANHIIS